MTPINSKPPIGQVSVDAQLLAKRLAKAVAGEQVAYQELNKLIGRNVQNGARYVLYTACNVVLREHGLVFGTVAGKGVVRLTDQELTQIHRPALARIGRISKRTTHKMAKVENWDALTDSEKRAYSAGLGALGAVALFSSSKAQKALEDSVTNTTAPAKPDTEKLIALFSK